MNQLEWVYNLIKELVSKKFTGDIRINFNSGGITNINKSESLKLNK